MGCFFKNESLHNQVGVGFREEEKRKGKTLPLAPLAAMANIHNVNFVGRLALDSNHHWILTCRAGVILPTGDQVVLSDRSDDVLNSIRKEDKSLAIAFDSVDVNETDDFIKSWIRTTGRPTRNIPSIVPIQDVGSAPKSHRKVYAALSIMGVCGAIGASGYHFYAEHQAEKLAEKREEERLLREVLARAQEAEKPWESWPTLQRVYNTCVDIYSDRKKNINGWKMISWTCDEKKVVEKWNRTDVGAFSLPPVGGGEINLLDPNNLNQTFPMPSFQSRGEDAINKKSEAGEYLLDLARINDTSINISWGAESTRRVPKGDSSVLEGLGYAENTATLRLEGMPHNGMVSGLSEISAIKLNKLSNNQGEWELVADFFTTYEG